MKKLKVVSLYTGAGGLDYGFEAVGFETVAAVEMDNDCCRTLGANRQWPLLAKPIESIKSKEILEAAAVAVGDVDVLIGGPPCQPFSKSSYWVKGDTRRLEDPRANTLYEYMRCVEDLLPEAFLLENVHGISYSGKEEGFLMLYRMTEEINARRGTEYELSWAVLNAADYGVPQLRRRFFLVGHRGGRRFEFPAPTHSGAAESDCGQLTFNMANERPHVTAWDALADVSPAAGEDLQLKSYWRELLPSIPEGENYLWHTNRKGGLPLFGWRTRYWSFLLKLAKNRPAWTVQANPGPAIGPFHWENRMLSVRELARIQTFPDDVRFVGKRSSVQRQIGNAVPALLAEVLAREIGRQFFSITFPYQPVLAMAPKRPIPPPEPIAPVPDKYLHLIGDHPDHPGTGRGKRAARRSELIDAGD